MPGPSSECFTVKKACSWFQAPYKITSNKAETLKVENGHLPKTFFFYYCTKHIFPHHPTPKRTVHGVQGWTEQEALSRTCSQAEPYPRPIEASGHTQSLPGRAQGPQLTRTPWQSWSWGRSGVRGMRLSHSQGRNRRAALLPGAPELTLPSQ